MPTENQPSADEQKEYVTTTDEKKVNRTRELLKNLADDNGHRKDADVNTIRFNFRFKVGQVTGIIAKLIELSGDNDAFSISCSRAADELIHGVFKDTVDEILLYTAGPDDKNDLPF